MKIFKKLFAAVLVCIMALSVTACHPKNEVAVTINGIEFTSAYYMCALINANTEAQSKVYEKLTEEEQQKEIDYYSKKIDDKEFVTWVEDRAIEMLKEIAAYKTKCKDNKLQLDEETVSMAEYYASYYWSSYGYSAYFEPNGVGEQTYTNFMKDSYYSNLYFEHVYGKDGEKEIPAKDVKEKLYGNFIIADLLEVNFSEETADEKKAIKEKLDGYVKNYKDGKMTFEEIYNDYNDVKETDTEETESEEVKPLDKYASVIGAEGTGYEHDYYDKIKKLDTDEIKLFKLDEDAGYILAIKKEIKDDPYYLDNLDITVRHLIADEEFKADIAKYAKTLEADINNYAVKQFKVKKIKEPEYQ